MIHAPHTLVGNALHSLFSLFSKSIKPALLFAFEFVNAIKKNEATIETIALVINSKIAAASIPIFEKWLDETLRILRFATIEGDKTIDEVIADASAYLATLTDGARAAQLNSLAALVAMWYADHTGESMSIQDALTAVQTVYIKNGEI